MQFGDDPSISHVANRFMGTGLLRAPLPGKLSRPLLSAMVRAAGGTIRHQAGGVGNSRPVQVLCIRVCFREKEPLRTHVNAVQTAEDELISPVWSSVPGRDCSGATAELVVPTTLLWVYGGRFVPPCCGREGNVLPTHTLIHSIHCIVFLFLHQIIKCVL